MYTEEEAKTKGCPIGRITATMLISISTSDVNNIINAGHCVASHCMWWRWNKDGTATGVCGIAGGENA